MAAKRKRNAPRASEKAAWREVLSLADAIRKSSAEKTSRAKAQRLMEIAADMLDQLAEGIHTNPPLTVFSLINPPTKGAQLMSDRLYQIDYKHKGNGKNYYHDFRKGTQMLALPSGDVLIRRPGAKVWGDYPAE